MRIRRCKIVIVDKSRGSLWRARLPGTSQGREGDVHSKIDLHSLSIEELVALRDNAIAKFAEKAVARQAELAAELEKLSQYGKSAKKSPVAPAIKKAKKGDDVARKNDEANEPIARLRESDPLPVEVMNLGDTSKWQSDRPCYNCFG